MIRSVIVHGPAGCGKTKNSRLIQAKLRLMEIVELDEEMRKPGFRIQNYGVLYLSQRGDLSLLYLGVDLMQYDVAMRGIH